MKIKKRRFRYRRCEKCEVLQALLLKKEDSEQEEYFSRFTTPESIVQEMNRLHNTFISVIKEQKHLVFWGEATKRYCQLLDKYHMEISRFNPKNFILESSLAEEAYNNLMELGITERRTEKEQK